MDKMTFAKPFGDMLKEKRKLRGLSQMGLAMKSGRSLRCIQYLEAGTQEPTLSTLYAIAHALDLRVMDLIEALPEELNGYVQLVRLTMIPECHKLFPVVNNGGMSFWASMRRNMANIP